MKKRHFWMQFPAIFFAFDGPSCTDKAWTRHSDFSCGSSRVSRLGEFRLLGSCLIWKLLGKTMYLQNQYDWATFFHSNSFVLFLTKKRVGQHFGPFFPQTHLVTLALMTSLEPFRFVACNLSIFGAVFQCRSP
jgi:hypothetical protein